MSAATGGILSGLLSGFRLGEADTRQRKADARVEQEFDYTTQRRGVLDGYQDKEFVNRQEDRATDVKRKAVEEDRKGVVFKQGQQDRVRALAREPVEYAQKDERHGLAVKQANQQMGQSAAGFASSQRDSNMRAEMMKMGLDQEKVAQNAQKARRTVLSSLATAETTGNWPLVVSSINSTLGQDNGYQVKAIQPQEDGSLLVDFGGEKPMKFANVDALAEAALKLTDPDTYGKVLESTMQQRRGGMNGGRPQGGVQQQLVEFYMQNMNAIDGESKQERFMRASAEARKTDGMDSNARYDKFLTDLTDPGMNEREIEQAMAMAKKMADGGAVFGGGSPAQAGPQGRDAGPSEQPPRADAKKGADGSWYVPDPNRPGKYMKVG